MNHLFRILVLALALAPAAHAKLKPVNGVVEINAAGDTGERGGDVNLWLGYGNPEKTELTLRGTVKMPGAKVENLDERWPLSAVKSIRIWTNGGNGYSGSDGSSGWNGSDGSSGWSGSSGSDGCPPSSGSDGSDGSDGTDGGSGGNGGSGGDAGNGGSARISVPADQRELFLLVSASAEGGSGGAGGRGGSGGSGGRGGRGGSGGAGGRSTCTDEKGNPTGSDASSGRDGRDGRDGSNGSSGSDGYSGSNGRDGTVTWSTTDAAGARDYLSRYEMAITAIKVIDENEDSVLSPGENLHVTEITIANKGGMPSPTAFALSWAPTTTLVPRTAPATALEAEIPAGGSRTLTFPKGALVFTAPAKRELLGREAVAGARLGANVFSLKLDTTTPAVIRWLAGIDATNESADVFFGSEKTLGYVLKNAGSKDIGPGAANSVELEVSWSSKEIPGADVTVQLEDGSSYRLDRPFTIANLAVAARSARKLSLRVKTDNSKALFAASGALSVALKARGYAADGDDTLERRKTSFHLVKDLRAVAFNRAIKLAGSGLRCRFPNRWLSTDIAVIKIEIAKSANSDEVRMRYTGDGVFENEVSPIMKTTAFAFGPYGILSKSDNAAAALGLLNEVMVPLTGKLAGEWKIKAGSCSIRKNKN